MNEDILYDRIGETDFNPDYIDGQVLQHIDMNKIVSITKEGVNENYHDIQRLQNGDKSAGNAMKLDSATLSRYIDEELEANDSKVPSSQQVKAYIDGKLANIKTPIRGVDYWTDEDKQEIIDEATAEVEETAFTTFDVVDGKLIAGYSRSDEDYYFQLNGNKLEVVIEDE